MDNINYLLVLKQAGIDPFEGKRICDMLSDETLKRLTQKGFDRRLIKPLLQKASVRGSFGRITDDGVNDLLNDTNYITSLMKQYIN